MIYIEKNILILFGIVISAIVIFFICIRLWVWFFVKNYPSKKEWGEKGPVDKVIDFISDVVVATILISVGFLCVGVIAMIVE